MAFAKAITSAWCWFLYGLLTVVNFPFLVLVAIFTIPFDPARHIAGRFFRSTAVIWLKLHPIWDYSVYGEVPHPSPRGKVFVANHLSFADSALLALLPWEMKWLSKSSILKIPFFGWGMWIAGDGSLHRGHRDSAKNAMKYMSSVLAKGGNVMIYPEGTRSKTGELGDFKDGAFRLAIETQRDLIPIAIAGTGHSLSPTDWKLNPAKALCSVGTPISTTGMTLDDVPKLRDLARAQIAAMILILNPLCSRTQHTRNNRRKLD